MTHAVILLNVLCIGREEWWEFSRRSSWVLLWEESWGKVIVYCLCFFFFFQKIKFNTNRSSSLPQETLLLKRLISSPDFNSVTLWHHTTLHNLCLATSLAHKSWFNTAALLLFAMLAQACVSWRMRARYWEGVILKETGAKTERFRKKAEWENWCVFLQANISCSHACVNMI